VHLKYLKLEESNNLSVYIEILVNTNFMKILFIYFTNL